MSALPSTATTANRNGALSLTAWLPIAAGLLALYVPTLIDLFSGLWTTDEQAHGPIVMSIAIWLLYRQWPDMQRASVANGASWFAWVMFAIGLFSYIVGRSQEVVILEVGSVIWILAGIIWVIGGTGALKVQWFALLFMCFMVPLPAPVVEAFTMPMKMAVSYVAEHVLFWVGYPIARSGVILQIGPYKLLVAEACAGLHTLLSLEAMGLLYLNLVRHYSPVRNIVLAILIVPISFVANVIRVMALTLITYHLGDEAGQGFLHDFSGIVLFLSGLILIVALDSLVRATTRAPAMAGSS